jgi:phage N-6-adenine-methyltransferase
MPVPKQKPGNSKQDYGTPDNFIQAVKRRLGISRFAVDFAADASNAKAPHYFTRESDGLAQEWAKFTAHGWGWCNPEFANIEPWAKKAAECRSNGGKVAFLVPASVGSNWFANYVDGYALVLALNGRLAFMPDRPTWLYPKDCILALYHRDIEPGFKVWDWRKDV